VREGRTRSGGRLHRRVEAERARAAERLSARRRAGRGRLAGRVFNLLPGTGTTVGRALAAHPGVDMVSLTGSVAAGRSVMQAAAEGIRRVALELGGKSSMVVLDDASLADGVGRRLASCFSNNGQMCSALTRLLVRHDQLDKAAELAATAAGGYLVGDPLDPATTIGPLVSKEQQQRVQRYDRLASMRVRDSSAAAPIHRPG